MSANIEGLLSDMRKCGIGNEGASGSNHEPDHEPKIVLPDFDDDSELVTTHLERPPLLIEGVLHKGLKMAIGGGSKTYKTWCLMDLAHAVATGREWLGFKCNYSGPVLFVNFEIHRAFYQERRKKLTEIRTPLQKGQLFSWNLRGYAQDVAKFENTLLERIKDYPPFALIVVDPIYKLLGARDNNSAGEIADLVNSLERIALKSEAAVVIGAHFSKGNQSAKDPIDRFGGSKVYGADPDVLLTLTAHETPNAFVADFILRNLPPIDSFVVEWKYPLFTRNDSLDVSKLKQPGGGRKEKAAPDDLLELLRGHDDEWTTTEWMKACQEKLGIEEATFYKKMKELKQSQKVFKSAATDKWGITAAHCR